MSLSLSCWCCLLARQQRVRGSDHSRYFAHLLCVCLLQAVVRDVRGLGVMFAPQLRYFTCLAGPKEAIQQRTSLPELTALFQVRTQPAVSRVRQGRVCLDGCAHRVVSVRAAATHAWAPT